MRDLKKKDNDGYQSNSYAFLYRRHGPSKDTYIQICYDS